MKEEKKEIIFWLLILIFLIAGIIYEINEIVKYFNSPNPLRRNTIISGGFGIIVTIFIFKKRCNRLGGLSLFQKIIRKKS